MKALLFLILLCICPRADASDTELHLGRFSTNDLKGWKEQTIGLMKPKTNYILSRENDKEVLVAHSTKSASGRIYTLKVDPKEYSTLKWSWKIDHTISKGDEKTKEGDDFAVRVYVLFPRGFFSRTRAICYVWANRLPKGEHVASPFSANIITVAVDSGEELAGRWTFHQRNVYEDYRNFFGEEPPNIRAVAVMTDSDNTGETAVGYYGDISLVHSPKGIIDTKQKDQMVKESLPKEAKPKDQAPREIQNNVGPSAPLPDIQHPVKPVDDSKHREPNRREQSSDTKTPPPAAAPQTPVMQ